jgi:hypothetical protein
MPGLFSRFYKKNPIEKIMEMTDEELEKAIDKYITNYANNFYKRNPGKNLPDIPIASLNDIRNKRTGVSKKPQISGRRSYK